MSLADLDPKVAAAVAHVPKGATSDAIRIGSNWVILHRLPRDFKWNADRLFQEAVD